MPADPRRLAQEAIELAGKATPGPWRGSMTGHSIKAARDFDEVLFAVPCDGRLPAERWREWLANVDLTCHAGTHYATIARALIEALDERDAACAAAHSWDDAHNDVCKTLEHITADRDALLADLPHVLGRCECVREVVARDGRGDPTFGYPEAHTVALAWLNGRIP